MNKKNLILLFLFAISGILYYNILVDIDNSKTVIVGRVIDGDTFETKDGEKIRILGINTPEKNEPLYPEAKEFLIKEIENKSIEIDIKDSDRYGRTLAHIDKNKDLLENGLAYLYYYEKDSYYNALKKAEESARNSKLGLWKKSPNENCIELIELKE